ncbi:epoxide hydrolase family protein [Actinomadura parmotrematis]|uniref:Epoxide hydrolase n=1 Tax=Actinomadura parmotrematis TaxID=2864039 RepID=A0ABS7FYU0_9ACTN|nr:epoxide hydrolase family protein [Actinomadura parmotrematis]MBW8485614.1 epoxide hydrolase [Actinomadura parmotrematis]
MTGQGGVPFTVEVSDEVLADLRARLARTRWTDAVADGWGYGADTAYVKELCSYWGERFDWRARERELNELDHYRADVDGLGIHFIHQRSDRPDATVLVLLHGWPGSFVQMLKILPLLTDFHVVVPSLPGFGFSDRPTEPGMNVSKIGGLLVTLLHDVLGYDAYAVRASDLGLGVAMAMAMKDPDGVIGLHMGGSNPSIPFDHLPEDLSAAEQKMVEDAKAFQDNEYAYAKLQSTKPQSLAVGLNDSPAGLAAWITEKYQAWSDCGGQVEKAFTKDELLTTITLYWVTQTIGSSMRLYYENAHTPGEWGAMRAPIAMAMPPADLFHTPREWAERQGPIARWTELARGGHFPEWEVPDLIADDIRAFLTGLGRAG